MCIVIFKNSGVNAPDDKIIDQCWENNPDGAGVMILRPHEKYVEYHKGCMELKEFKHVLSGLRVQQEDFVAYHFRIATSGGVNKEMTHPFPASERIDVLKSLDGHNKRVFMHNGVLGPGEKDLSDTALYVKHKLSKIPKLTKYQNDIAAETSGSRTITFDSSEGVLMTGTWVEDKGLSFSNSTYKEVYFSRSYWYGNSWPMYSKGGSYNDGYAKYCKLSDEEGWSDEAYEYCGCGYGHRSRAYCPGCEFQEICERGMRAIESGFIPETCEDFLSRSDRTLQLCNGCSLRHSCTDRIIEVPRKHKQWIEGKGYCIAVY